MARERLSHAIRQIQRLLSGGTISGLSEVSLLRQFVSSGDDEAFAALVARHGLMVIDAEFPNGTTLGGLLKHIKQATTDETFPGIPIYVNRVGLRQAERDVGFPLKLNIKQRPVHVILDNTCLDMGISYIVVDGYLMIDSRTGILEQRVQQIDRKLDQVLDALKRLENAK